MDTTKQYIGNRTYVDMFGEAITALAAEIPKDRGGLGTAAMMELIVPLNVYHAFVDQFSKRFGHQAVAGLLGHYNADGPHPFGVCCWRNCVIHAVPSLSSALIRYAGKTGWREV